MLTWQYLVKTEWLSEKALNLLGEDGWELVIANHFYQNGQYEYWFKRPRQSPQDRHPV